MEPTSQETQNRYILLMETCPLTLQVGRQEICGFHLWRLVHLPNKPGDRDSMDLRNGDLSIYPTSQVTRRYHRRGEAGSGWLIQDRDVATRVLSYSSLGDCKPWANLALSQK